jgi:uncharacterized protein YcnI
MIRPTRITRVVRVLACSLVCAGTLAIVASPAPAHIQVHPTTAAPDDAVLFEVLVPNERAHGTTRVELAVPAGVIPFSYQEAPGWHRSLTLKGDGSTRSIVWRGRMRPDGFARFSFLASTPPRERDIAWKTIQTYDDGRKVRWIGAPDADNPAASTTVSKRFPRQNAGGEGNGKEQTPASSAAAGPTVRDDTSDNTARWLAAGALVAALAALAVSILRRRQVRPS